MEAWERERKRRMPRRYFKRLYGVKPDTFEKMKAILQKAYEALHKQ
jgi:hypothetical protein